MYNLSGGDLDGDQFMAIWDIDLIPREIADPVLYKDLVDSKVYKEFKPDYLNDNIIQPFSSVKIRKKPLMNQV